MKKLCLLLATTPLAFATPVWAEDAAAADTTAKTEAAQKAEESKRPAFTTGVAKGRDMLDTAISASALDGVEIEKLGARSLADVMRNIPGIRAEAVAGEGNASYSIRGLPLASSGAKFLQFQEDGLPVLEFGDFNFFGPDVFLRADLNLSQVQTIRGGSASTFGSNAPGGVINLISKTGETEGGEMQLSTGLDYKEYRGDFSYGGKLSDTLRFHVGGFYRQGEGARKTGYDALKGGQIQFNITKDLGSDSYIRVYGKYLNDRTPSYLQVPIKVTGTDANPNYESLPGFDISKDTLNSPYTAELLTLDGNNKLAKHDMRDGMHPVVKSIGFETKFDVAGWTITDRFRYANITGNVMQNFPLVVAPASALMQSYGGPLAKLSYATGPQAGQQITDIAGLNGNGLMAYSLFMDVRINSLDNLTNDLRASRVWNVGKGKLTATAGFYRASQDLDTSWLFTSAVTDILGGGNTHMLDITDALGRKQTQGGYFAYSAEIVTAGYRRGYDVDYTVNAPYASLNYNIGKLAVGGSVRYDMGKASGQVFGMELGGGRVGTTTFDMNGDGTISIPETRVGILPLSAPGPVDYDYEYLSYSISANYRFAKSFSAFARYSRGARAAADRILFTPTVSYTTGALTNPESAFDPVRQAELGVKFRGSNIELFATGFWASTRERNMQINSDSTGQVQVQYIARSYEAKGVELEGNYTNGPFSLTAGATYTNAKIQSDLNDPTVIGHVPRHQAHFIFAATPQLNWKRFTIGTNVIGTTSSYAQDTNQLKLPAYTTVAAFAQFRPTDAIQLSINANNLFDVLGLAEVTQGSIPASGVVTARAINGRTISAAVRFSF